MLSEKLKNILLETGYEGGFTLDELLEDTKPYWRTIFWHDKGGYGASGSGFGVGLIDGCSSVEDALALVWINTSIQFKGQLEKKVRKKKVVESKMKYKGDPWGNNLLIKK